MIKLCRVSSFRCVSWAVLGLFISDFLLKNTLVFLSPMISSQVCSTLDNLLGPRFPVCVPGSVAGVSGQGLCDHMHFRKAQLNCPAGFSAAELPEPLAS